MRHKAIWGLLFLLAAVFLFPPSDSQAQTNDTVRLQKLLDDLNDMIEEGTKMRTADPWFLQDLQDLVNQYDNPWRVSLYNEEFRSNGAPPTPWRVVSGDFKVDWRFGMRSMVRAPTVAAAPPASSPQAPPPQNVDPGIQLLGAILQGVIAGQNNQNSQSGTNGRTKGGTTTTSTTPPPPPVNTAAEPAIAYAPRTLTNAFQAEFILSMRDLNDGSKPAVELGVYQAIRSAHPGYRVSYSQEDRTLSLIRVSSRGGRSIIETSATTVNLNDGKDHTLVWARYPDGRMTIGLDGTEIMVTTDRGYKDPWDGVVLHQTGGDFALRQIKILGTN